MIFRADFFGGTAGGGAAEDSRRNGSPCPPPRPAPTLPISFCAEERTCPAKQDLALPETHPLNCVGERNRTSKGFPIRF